MAIPNPGQNNTRYEVITQEDEETGEEDIKDDDNEESNEEDTRDEDIAVSGLAEEESMADDE